MKKNASFTWHVQTDSGSCFGPASLDELKLWAREGRLMATYLVSRDGENWLPISELSELDMHDLVETEPGAYFGPVHREVVAELMRAGELPKGACVYRKVANGAAEKKAVESSEKKLEKEVKRLTALAEKLEAEKVHAQHALEKQSAALEKKLEKAVKRSTALSEKLDAQAARLTRALERAEALEAERDAFCDAAHDAQAVAAAQRRALDDLEAELAALHAREAEAARQPVILAVEPMPAEVPVAVSVVAEEAPPLHDNPRARLEEQLKRELLRAGQNGFPFLKRK